MSNNIVTPGILEKDWSEIDKKIQQIIPFAKTIHIDLIDGKFAPNITFLDPSSFSKYTKDALFELHMMTEEPINYLKPWADAGFRRFIGHIEKMSDQAEFVAQGELLGEVGLAIDSATSVDQIEVSIDDLDVLLIMTVKTGESGQNFIEANLSKIREIKKSFFTPIQIDGGVDVGTIMKAKQKGASRFVATSFIFSGNPQENYEKLMKALKEAPEA